MTILEAIRAKAIYPMSEDFFQSILIERGLSDTDNFTIEVGRSTAFRGALADVFYGIAMAPSISEGDISITKESAEILKKSANDLYISIGESPKGVPTITFID